MTTTVYEFNQKVNLYCHEWPYPEGKTYLLPSWSLGPSPDFILGGKKLLPFFSPPPHTLDFGICRDLVLIDFLFIRENPRVNIFLWISFLYKCRPFSNLLSVTVTEEPRIIFFDPQGGWVGQNFSPSLSCNSSWVAWFSERSFCRAPFRNSRIFVSSFLVTGSFSLQWKISNFQW